MKIRKLKGDWRSNDDVVAMCRMINALDRARIVSNACADNAGFQNRCVDAIVALANRLVEERVERFYEPETRKFTVTFDVKRSGCHAMTVDAKDEAEAKAKAEERLRGFADSWFNARETSFVAADVVEAKEVQDGEA